MNGPMNMGFYNPTNKGVATPFITGSGPTL